MAITFVAGQEVTADDLNALVPKYLLQTADQTLNTVTMTNHNTFANVSVGANEVWEFTFNLIIPVGTAASDIKVDWATNGTVTTGSRHCWGIGVTSTVTMDAPNITARGASTNTDISYGVSATEVGSIIEKATVDGGASGGGVFLRWSCVAASGNVTVQAGSYMVAHRLT